MTTHSRAALVGAASVALVVGLLPAAAAGPRADARRAAAVDHGGRITFISDREGSPEVFVMDADGGNVRRLTHNNRDESGPAWSPDGRRIAFTSHDSSTQASYHEGDEVFVINADGSGLRQLTHTPWWRPGVADSGSIDPVWSPDGRRIAFTRVEFIGPEDERGNVFVMDADGGNVTRLTEGGLSYEWFTPMDIAWSPNGKRIAFVKVEYARKAESKGASAKVYVMDADGGDRHRLMRRNLQQRGPVWSPDGRRIAFEANGVYVVRPDGRKLRRVTHSRDSDLVWSPNGRRIAFTRQVGRTWRNGHQEVYLMDPDGRKLRRLTRNHADDWGPIWSPEGRRIAFHSTRGRGGLYVMDATGGNVHRLTGNVANDDDPAWFGPAPTRTTVNARPEPVVKGRRLTLTGTVTRVGVALPWATVKITFKAKGASQFTTVTSLRTGAAGRYRTKVMATKSGTWKATHPATAATRTSTATDRVTVRR